MINLNVLALTQLTHLFLPQLVAQKQGTILNVASTASFSPGPMMSVYFATKSFVLSFTEALSEEVKQHNIKVLALCPGPTLSDFAKSTRFDVSEEDNAKSPFPASGEVAKLGYKK